MISRSSCRKYKTKYVFFYTTFVGGTSAATVRPLDTTLFRAAGWKTPPGGAAGKTAGKIVPTFTGGGDQESWLRGWCGVNSAGDGRISFVTISHTLTATIL